MAKQISKNWIIVGLLCTNMASAYYILHGSTVTPKPAVVPPAPKPKAQVQGGSLEESGAIQACYETFLTRRPAVSEGVVHVHWMIDKMGKIDFLKLIKTDLADEKFTNCIMDEIRGTTFPAPRDRVGVLISHRFKFKRKDHETIRFD